MNIRFKNLPDWIFVGDNGKIYLDPSLMNGIDFDAAKAVLLLNRGNLDSTRIDELREIIGKSEKVCFYLKLVEEIKNLPS